MKTIDLGEKTGEMTAPKAPKRKWYPTISFSDNGVAGVSSFDDEDVGKMISVQADLRLTGIQSRTDKPNKKKFDYEFEVHKIHMPDDLSSQEEYKQLRQSKRKG